MSIIAEFSIPSESLPAGEALTELPDLRLELDRVVPTRESALPFFWAWGDDVDRFVDAAGSEPAIEDLTMLSRVEQGALFRSEWTPDADLIRGIKQLRATVLQATGTADGWSFRVRADDRERIATFQRLFTDNDVPVSLDRIYHLSELVAGEHYELTPEQQETLLAAYREGYFDKPRRTTQGELGDRFGITARAVSERLRRGTRNLVASTLGSRSVGHQPRARR